MVGETRSGDEYFVIRSENPEQGESSEGTQDDSNGDGNRSRQGDSDHTLNGNEVEGRPRGIPLHDRQHQPGRVNLTQTEEFIPTDEVEGHWQELQRRSYRRSGSSRHTRVNVRRKLLERWKRRQFYLDEEEGALPPDGWDDGDDILATYDGGAEILKSAQPPPPSPRSRSSSKVRFAEDTDDYETRSSPSTSSRTIPERWGGMDIPDAERDAGKEIFYQVMQQAFNEILDLLFKVGEDLAVEAAETKDVRDKYRHIFQSIDFPEQDSRLASPLTSSDFALELNKVVHDQPLEELISASGYSVEPADQFTASSGEREGEETSKQEGHDAETFSGEGSSPGRDMVEESEKERTAYRDPTMPQFRPDSASFSMPARPLPSADTPASDRVAVASEESKAETSTFKGKSTKATSSTPIPLKTLMKWKRLDSAEEEARKRGGWGKLSYEEFEAIYRIEESSGCRLDYLGAWIDFCIP